MVKVNFSKHFEYETSCQLLVLLWVIYIFIIDIYLLMINIIISVKGLPRIGDRLQLRYARLTNLFLQVKQQVPDKYREACKLLKLIKFSVVS